jgi:hypothetical protein
MKERAAAVPISDGLRLFIRHFVGGLAIAVPALRVLLDTPPAPESNLLGRDDIGSQDPGKIVRID